MNASRSSLRAMTLLEVLLAISLATMLLGAIGRFAWDIAGARARLADEAARASCAEAVFTALERAMQTAVVEDDAQASGILGSESSLRVRSNALQPSIPREVTTRSSGYSVTHVQFTGGRLALDLGRGLSDLDAPVRAFRLRYLLRDGWKNAFDSRVDGGFPVAIEASIWFAREGAIEGQANSVAADRTRLFRTLDAPALDPLAVLDAREAAPVIPLSEEE